ncbi:MAG: hypothetical protein QF662_03695, partial [Phycisphaerae bacterium]|nr:hypothetical protein [Phycisphaerae bacterium]
DPLFSDGTRLQDYVSYNPQYVHFGIVFQGGGSIHNDGSIMNHWTVNYGYSKTTSCRFASLLWYKLAGRTPPEGLTTIGVKRTRDFFVRMIKPWGGHIGPNGNYGRYGHLYEPIYYLLYWDATPEAWAAFQTTFNAVKKLVETGSVGPGYNTFGNYYQSKLFGPLKAPAKKLTTKQLMTRLSGVHVSPTAKYVVHRSPASYSVYSWHSFSANGGMLDMDPVVQDTTSDCGVVVRSKRAKDTGYVQDTLIPQSWVKTTVYGPVVTDDGFSVITRRDSKYGVTNHTAFVSLPNCNTVLVSRTIAREDMEVDKLEMGTVTFLLNQEKLGLGINKWPWWGDHKLRLPEGRGSGGRPAWVNVGNRMGYVAIGTSPTASVGGESVVFERYTKKRTIKAGGEIGRVILVTFPGVTAEETARLADGVQLLRAAPEGVYAVRVPKTKGLSAPVWVIVNFRSKAVDITLPLEAGGDGKVTVKARSCLVVSQGPARKG